MELQLPYCICAKVQKKSLLRREARRNKGDPENIMSMEMSGNYRRRSMSRPHTHVSVNTAEIECFRIHGILEREKQFDDISKMGKHEICI